jgi:hypothetical protein
MAEIFTENNKNLLNIKQNKILECHSVPVNNKKFIFQNKIKTDENERQFGEVYLCNEETFGEFFRIQEFDTYKIEKFQGTEDKLFIFFQDEKDENRIAIIEK